MNPESYRTDEVFLKATDFNSLWRDRERYWTLKSHWLVKLAVKLKIIKL